MFRLLMKTETKYGKLALDVDDVNRFLVYQPGFSMVFHIFFEAGDQLPVTPAPSFTNTMSSRQELINLKMVKRQSSFAW